MAAALVPAIQNFLACPFGFRLLAYGEFAEHVRRLVHPAALLSSFRPDLAGRLPEAERGVGDHQLRCHVEPAALEIEQQLAPVVRALACAVGKIDGFLAAFRRRADDDEDALLLVFEARFNVDAVRSDVDVAPSRQFALPPPSVLVLPAVLQAADRGHRKSHGILA